MDAAQVLAFRLARSGLTRRDAPGLAAAAACPASDFSRDAALLAVAARREPLAREEYDAAVDSGDLIVAHIVRGAIHALAPPDLALYGRALIATGDDELAAQLGRQVKRLTAEHGIAPTDALAEVADATQDALGGSGALGKNALHEAYRARVREELMPWCRGCKSHHVAPMLWRYATVAAGAPGEDGGALDAPPAAEGVRLLPPGDPYLAMPNRPLLAPEAELRKRLFRPVGSPGAVLMDGRLAGLWRTRAKGRTVEITVEPLGRLARADLEPEAERVAALRGGALVLR